MQVLLGQYSYADRGDHIAIKGSWAKGGRDRAVPITTQKQRTVLDEAHQLAGSGSLIPAHKTYIQQRHTYGGQCKAARLSNMHGLRHQYSQVRYELLTGWKAPTTGGSDKTQFSLSQRMRDQQARQQISRELGHERRRSRRFNWGLEQIHLINAPITAVTQARLHTFTAIRELMLYLPP
ncbi:MAG: integrase [Castellaniella sp.]